MLTGADVSGTLARARQFRFLRVREPMADRLEVTPRF
jgi:hypothetical protein